jgi:hypothetical protein
MRLTASAAVGLCAAVCGLGGSLVARAQIVSNFQSNAGSFDWHNPLNWSAGVPQNAGDIARQTSPGLGSSAVLTAPATVGELLFDGSGSGDLNGTAVLTFDQATDAAPRLTVDGTSRIVFVRPKLAVGAGAPLAIDVDETSNLTLTGGFSAGDVVKQGLGMLAIYSGDANYAGTITVAGGTLRVLHAAALGSASGPTNLTGGTTYLDVNTGETFVFRGGTLATQATQNFPGAVVTGGLVIPAGQVGLVNGPLHLRGGSTGDGDLSIALQAGMQVTDAPLNHRGRLNITGTPGASHSLQLGADNSYGGETKIVDANVNADAPNSLGSVDAPTSVVNGTMRMNWESRETIALQNSRLTLFAPLTSPTEAHFRGHVTLESSILATNPVSGVWQQFALSEPVSLAGGASSFEPRGQDLRILGGVTGQGDLLLRPDGAGVEIIVGSELTFDGNLEIRNGVAQFATPNAFAGDVMVRNGGQLVSESDQHFRRLRDGGYNASCCNPWGVVEAKAGAVIQVDELSVREARLKGDLRTAGPIQFYGLSGLRTIQNLSSGIDVYLHAGSLNLHDLDPTLGPTTGAVHSLRASEGLILLQDGATVAGDLHLHNGSGFSHGGALRTTTDSSRQTVTTLTGDVYLGEIGATIGGEGGPLVVNGQVRGGDLRVTDAARVILKPGAAAYTGRTVISEFAELTLQGAELTETTAIEVRADSRLAIDVGPGGGATSDAVPDDVPVDLAGGELGVWPTTWGVNATERIGRARLVEGQSIMKGMHYGGSSIASDTELVVGQLDRERGAVLTVTDLRDHSTTPFASSNPQRISLVLEQPPALVNGVLPAWIRMHDGNIATYGPNGVSQYQGPFTTLAAGNDAGIVNESSGSHLTGDKTVHAVQHTPGANLGGHTLTVGGGALNVATISNGRLQPGEHAANELIINNSTLQNVSIADNGGPTSVVYVGDNTVTGASTYTGMTTVTGRAGSHTQFRSASAVSTGGDFEVVGRAAVSFQHEFPLQFGKVSIRNGGVLSGPSGALTAERVELEEGRLGAALVGTYSIEKTTQGVAHLSTKAGANFTGSVNVRDGLLVIEDRFYSLLGKATIEVFAGGRLVLPQGPRELPTGAAPGRIRLNGGALYSAATSLSEANLIGTVDVVDDSQIVILSGESKTLSVADLFIDGTVRVATGKTLELIGLSGLTVGPELKVRGGIILEPGATLQGDGALRGNVSLSDGAILSPGSASTGSSVGMLTMFRPETGTGAMPSRMTWGPGGRYRFEINDAQGEAGAPYGRGWDLMHVQSDVQITATDENPFVIELVGLGLDGLPGEVARLEPNQEYRWTILAAGALLGFDPAKFEIDATGFDVLGSLGELDPGAPLAVRVPGAEFHLEADTAGIHLVARTVPEPALAGLMAGACLLAPQIRRGQRRGSRRGQTNGTMPRALQACTTNA